MRGLSAVLVGFAIACTPNDNIEKLVAANSMVGVEPHHAKAQNLDKGVNDSHKELSEALTVVWRERDRLAKELGTDAVGVERWVDEKTATAVNCAVGENGLTVYTQAVGKAYNSVGFRDGVPGASYYVDGVKETILKNGVIICVRVKATLAGSNHHVP